MFMLGLNKNIIKRFFRVITWKPYDNKKVARAHFKMLKVILRGK